MAFLHGATATHSGPKSGIKSRSITPYLLLAPGLIWLVTFFIIPILSLASTSTMVRPEGAQVGTYVQELRFQNYVDAFLANQDQYIRSFVYAG
ncbi:MAG: ABC transporter permease, partial [Candidatus Nanopelagicaceae bacterium]